MRRFLIALGVSAAVVGAAPAIAGPITFRPVVLAADQPHVGKVTTDPALINPWGITASPTSPFWLGINGSGISEIYRGDGTKASLVVTIPGDGSVTGTTFSGVAGAFNSNAFLFASEDGTISGWRGALGTNAEVLQTADPANVYKGIAVGSVGGHEYAYAANFRHGSIDVTKGDAGAPPLTGTFTDPTLPSGYAPFNVANIGGTLYVTYALQDGAKKDDVPGAGHGFIARYDLNGNFLGELVADGALDSPWGLALAPASFGDLAGMLLVGNFGDGMINAYNPVTGALIRALTDVHGNPLVIDGLWGLRFGNDAAAGSANTLYFTAGPGGESHGRFGLLAVPEPASLTLLATALFGAALRRRRS